MLCSSQKEHIVSPAIELRSSCTYLEFLSNFQSFWGSLRLHGDQSAIDSLARELLKKVAFANFFLNYWNGWQQVTCQWICYSKAVSSGRDFLNFIIGKKDFGKKDLGHCHSKPLVANSIVTGMWPPDPTSSKCLTLPHEAMLTVATKKLRLECCQVVIMGGSVLTFGLGIYEILWWIVGLGNAMEWRDRDGPIGAAGKFQRDAWAPSRSSHCLSQDPSTSPRRTRRCLGPLDY